MSRVRVGDVVAVRLWRGRIRTGVVVKVREAAVAHVIVVADDDGMPMAVCPCHVTRLAACPITDDMADSIMALAHGSREPREAAK